ncbi:hypothetical protein [Marinigracilibium pacificum]|uniref:Uncharacterized protein n=1 Tax=Marinigracilibium pacificum TaxID=2729599 RepID=A0A848J2Z1_9BACT|nr:hypothetical protein [Marinigracilibium pacificum]NMM50126.1 hypothetical protein [Marinigracilibium pacificum]
MNKVFLTIIVFFIYGIGICQNNDFRDNIKGSKGLLSDRCKEYNIIVESLPNDMVFDLEVIDRQIKLLFPSEEYFQLLFDDTFDGIAIDIIDQDQYSCESIDNIPSSWPSKGMMIEPVYKNELLNSYTINEENKVVVSVGTIPNSLDAGNVECNLMILQKKALCDYVTNPGVLQETRNFIPTKLYWDTITSNTEINAFSFDKSIYFKIPFKKGKSRYNTSEIQELYDSLQISNYDITDIWIEAFSSVEGTVRENTDLQFARAKSITEALESYQTLKIHPHIKASENWKEFAKSISNTKFEFLKKLSQEQVKEKLKKDRKLLLELEPILSKQRYAEIRLDLRVKNNVINNPNQLVQLFEQSIESQDIDQALQIQNYFFKEVKEGRLPLGFINNLLIPIEESNIRLLNNDILFKLDHHIISNKEAIDNYNKISNTCSANWKIKFNLATLKIKNWISTDYSPEEQQVLFNQIQSMNNSDIQESVLAQLKINYYLAVVQKQIQKKEFDQIDQTIRTIIAYNNTTALNENEIFSISKALTYNGEFKTALNILNPVVNTHGVSEDVLFYYLRLFLVNNRIPENNLSDILIRKALSRNQDRFCQFFTPKSQGGVSFQYRNNKLINTLYCENCGDQGL